MRWTFIIFTLALFFYSCENKSTPTIYPSKIGVDSAYQTLALKNKKIKEEKIPQKKILKTKVASLKKPSTSTSAVTTSDRIIPFSKDNTTQNLVISYAKANAEVTKIAKQTNTFTFDSDSAKKVWIKISAQDSTANIRINHIKGPGDTIKGGPFGKETIFNLPARGIYQFSVSEKPTNKNPYAGKYKVELKLLWK
ncbi:hypothetical protein SAMN05443634_101226 [Chishuiella changwenlii]|uniref:Uncharacterized protein n=1 Tax=Chishuiella changwenlii TaxID=1434701 RepID=A0A1M6T283_9FLAO|nr:hypothetical protein [Chishuiella changwenlii]GGE94636.1 hypothetical protein GCM10010984_10230 [Chishuiella changwenlii]SHK51016.1 hypothetical protein SAMN05443634_101226 [Chishuiella changwenlii]